MNILLIRILTYISILIIYIPLLIIIYKKKENIKHKKLILLINSIITILIHYSCFFRDLLVNHTLVLEDNLVMIIYPCNFVMWVIFIVPFLNEDSKIFKTLVDFLVLVGPICATFGILLNPDFNLIKSLYSFKSVASHVTLLFNCLLLYALGYYKFNTKLNLKSLIIIDFVLLFIGLYNDILFYFFDYLTLSKSSDTLYMNSMWIFGTEINGLEWMNFGLISIVAIFIYTVILHLIELKIEKDETKRLFYKLKLFINKLTKK